MFACSANYCASKGLVAEMTSDYNKTFSFLFLIKTIKHAWPDLSREEHDKYMLTLVGRGAL